MNRSLLVGCFVALGCPLAALGQEVPALGTSESVPRVLEVPSAYGTIQAALDAAHPGDTVSVAAGVYAESLVIETPVRLMGAGSGADPEQDTILRGGDGTVGISLRGVAGQTEISQLHVTGYARNFRFESVSREVTLWDVRSSDSSVHGLEVDAQARVLRLGLVESDFMGDADPLRIAGTVDTLGFISTLFDRHAPALAGRIAGSLLSGSLSAVENDLPTGGEGGGGGSPEGICGGDGDCCDTNIGPGCNDIDCCSIVCAADPFCCDTQWDQICADQAASLCGDLCGGTGPCPLDCPPDALLEGEPCGADTNGGCNTTPDPVFVDAACGQTWCGTAWADGGMRDTDWYIVDHPGGVLSATVVSQFPAVCFILDGIIPCAPVIAGDIGCGDACANIAVASADLPAGTYVVFVAPGDCAGGLVLEGFPCGSGENDYVLTIDAENCTPPCPDVDMDGFTDAACGGEDCDDDNFDVNPDATEVCDGIDNDCDGFVDEVTTWFESGDAPEGVPERQDTVGGGPLTNIIGATDGASGDIVDTYSIIITDPEAFYATTATTVGGATGSATFDTRLYLWTEDGSPVMGNDDTSSDGLQSTISSPGIFAALTGGGLSADEPPLDLMPGKYLISITGFANDPFDDSPASTTPVIDASGFFSELHGPNPASTGIFGAWEGPGSTGNYNIELNGATFCKEVGATKYCTSNGASIGASSASFFDPFAEDTILTVTDVPNTFGLFFASVNQQALPGDMTFASCDDPNPATGFPGGTLCIGPGLMRLPPATLASGNMNSQTLTSAGLYAPGSCWNFQYWFRVPGMQRECDYTNAISITFALGCP